MKFNPKLKNIYLYVYWFICAVLICLISDFRYLLASFVFVFIISYFLGLIFLHLIRVEDESISYFTILSVGLALVLVFFNFWFVLDIEITKILLRGFFAIVFSYGSYLFYERFLKNHKITWNALSDTNLNCIILSVLFSFLFIIAFIPLKDLSVAPLHDPLAISIISKKIGAGDFTISLLDNDMKVYPNGLAVLVSLISVIFHLDYAKELLYLTNLFNVLVGISFYHLGKELFKRVNGGIVTLFVSMYISFFPLSLYYSAGKNAQIFGFFLSIITASYLIKICHNNNETFNFKKIIILALLTAGSHYAHYNSTVFLIGVFLSVFIVKLFFDKKIKTILVHFIKRYGIVILLTSVFLYPSLYIIENVGGIKFDAPSKFYVTQITLTSFINSFYGHLSLTAGKLLKTIWWFGLGTVVPILMLKKWNYLKSFIFLLSVLLWGMFTTSGIAERLHLFFISSSFSAMLTYIPVVLFFSYFLSFLLSILPQKYKHILLLFIIFSSIISGLWRMDRYLNAKNLSVVSEADIEAFDWINRNIKDDSFFVGRVGFTSTSFLTDAALYLPYYCEKDILLNFVATENFHRDNREDIQLYKSWVDDLKNKDSIKKLLKRKIRFIYLSNKSVFGSGGLRNDYFDKHKDLYEKIYGENQIGIWEIKEVD